MRKLAEGTEGVDDPHCVIFKCAECLKIFGIDLRKVSYTQLIELRSVRQIMKRSRGIDCIKCGAKKKAILMVKCPNPSCGKYYVPLSSVNPRAMMRDPRLYQDVCPHCKMNYNEAILLARKGAAIRPVR